MSRSCYLCCALIEDAVREDEHTRSSAMLAAWEDSFARFQRAMVDGKIADVDLSQMGIGVPDLEGGGGGGDDEGEDEGEDEEEEEEGEEREGPVVFQLQIREPGVKVENHCFSANVNRQGPGAWKLYVEIEMRTWRRAKRGFVQRAFKTFFCVDDRRTFKLSMWARRTR